MKPKHKKTKNTEIKAFTTFPLAESYTKDINTYTTMPSLQKIIDAKGFEDEIDK